MAAFLCPLVPGIPAAGFERLTLLNCLVVCLTPCGVSYAFVFTSVNGRVFWNVGFSPQGHALENLTKLVISPQKHRFASGCVET